MLNHSTTARTELYENRPCRLYAVLVLLCLCYFGKYFCTSDMYIVQSLFMKEEGVSDVQLSTLFALGYFFSMLGKVFAGAMSDAIGGKFVILIAALGYILSTLTFSMVPSGQDSFWLFCAAWSGIGFSALGLAWVAVVSVATNWIPVAYLGRLMGLVSMAPQLGDAVARLCLAEFLGYGWRTVFRIAALSALCLLMPVALFVGNSPGVDNAHSIAKQEENLKPKASYIQRLLPLLRNPFLWVLCLLSGSLYGTRTLFLLYSTSFLASSYCTSSNEFEICIKSGATMSATASASSLYTLLGCLSVLIVGTMKDKLPKRHRGATLTVFVLPLLLIMAYLMHTGSEISFPWAVGLVAATGFCLFGPYKVLGAVFAVDVGGKELKSTCTAFMGIFDNLFAMMMLFGKGVVGDDWVKLFTALTLLSCVSLLCAGFVWVRDLRSKTEELEQRLVPNEAAPHQVSRASFREHKEHQ
eukprot:TRINITY_DN111090_c0_g1_i1.p1 TRINITY_DN111090_c0_g1~~TRINITY_DN111090_c0_g1_i1.p1  ORF type:complete len:477 (-),score=74.77 TRINITY_DN111090_c0_g1_i1:273-1679(-)